MPPTGAYRLIDVPMSNCFNSGITKIYVLTQFNSVSLNRHLARAYRQSSVGGDGFVEVLAATQTPTDKSWFQGTADAVRQYSWLLQARASNRTTHLWPSPQPVAPRARRWCGGAVELELA
jgi:glucose-1-phosphate adenylyltransferase